MKRFDVCGFGNSLVDILVKISDEEFASLGYEKSSTQLLDGAAQAELLKSFKNHELYLASGGSVANSVIAVSQLGGKGAFTSCLGDDKYGLFYQNEFEELKIETTNPLIVGQTSGTCVCLITPDSERTMRACLGVSSSLSDKHVNVEVIAQSKWLFIEGYLFANPENGQKAVAKAIEIAKVSDCKVAITFSDAWILDLFLPAVQQAVKKADLIFANETEAKKFTKTSSREEAFKALSQAAPNVVMTAGEEGAHVAYNGKTLHVPAVKCQPVDLTGAGDMFAGAFLYGITHDVEPVKAARAGCLLASKVITRVGARLQTGTKDFWDQSLSE